MRNNNKMVGGNSNNRTEESKKQKSVASLEAVKNPALDYSHFISLPLAIHPQLVEKLFNFQNSILGLHNLNPNKVSGTSKSTLSELGIDKSIFINPKTFHLTVIMLKLWNKERVDAAVKIFKGITGDIMDALDGRPVSIKLKGLDLMRGSVDKACVLYAPVEVVGGEDRLLRACEVIREAFMKGGLVLEKDAKQALKLHVTIMNVRHRKRTKTTKKYDSFDARGIMEKYGSEEWGKYLIREIHLSQRFVYNEDGYYHCCASIRLPQVHNRHTFTKNLQFFCLCNGGGID